MKTIYGLKQSLKAWFDKFSKVIHVIGFQRSNVDYFVFVRKTIVGSVVLVVHVDGVLLTSSNIRGIDKTNEYLKKHFVTKIWGNLLLSRD